MPSGAGYPNPSDTRRIEPRRIDQMINQWPSRQGIGHDGDPRAFRRHQYQVRDKAFILAGMACRPGP